MPSLALATPRISQATSPSLEQGETLTIQGSGFVRNSSTPYAVMFDMADKAYVNGKLNTHNESFEESATIQRVNRDPNTLWWKPSLNSGEAFQDPSIVRSLKGRTYHKGGFYHLKGYNEFLGWPAAYGGFETPVDNSKLYVAWYLRMSYDPRFYWAMSPQNLQGKFIPGEKIKINGHSGRFIGIGTHGIAKNMLHFEIDQALNSSDLRSNKIIGQLSGATTIFPEKFAAGSGKGYEPPGANKFIRVWENPEGNTGLRVAWTQMQVGLKWHYAPITPDRWHLMEFMLDTDTNQLTVVTDRQWSRTVDIGNVDVIQGKWSPTIALLGFNGKIQEFQDIKIDDIYMDNSFSRVVIGKKPKFSQLTGYELQYPVRWENNLIEVKLNFGEIDPKTKSYLYVVNENGDVNQEGFPLCSSCEAPPSKIELGID
jgi:hypothetical protein